MKQERPIASLAQFLPPNSYEDVEPFFRTHAIQLTLTRERKTILGNYRAPTAGSRVHRITVNINLNPYNFLLTLLHEVAHLCTHVNHAKRVSPHGSEWKNEFKKILVPFIAKKVFPQDIELALMDYLRNPSASTCSDPTLFKAMYRYDERKQGYKLVDDVPVNGKFENEEGELFQKLEVRRTRSRCKSLTTGKQYLFPGIAEVKVVE
jgi:SprT protein